MRRNLFILTVGLLGMSGLVGCNHLPCKFCRPGCCTSKRNCGAEAPRPDEAKGTLGTVREDAAEEPAPEAPATVPPARPTALPVLPHGSTPAPRSQPGVLAPLEAAPATPRVVPATPVVLPDPSTARPPAAPSGDVGVPNPESLPEPLGPAPARRGAKPQLPQLAPLPPTSFAPAPLPVITNGPAPNVILANKTPAPRASAEGDLAWVASTGEASLSTTPRPMTAPVVPASEPAATARASVRAEPTADGYGSLTGRVQQWRNTWRLRYAPVDSDDPYGGSVTLVGGAELDRLQDGQRIRVRGVLQPAPSRGDGHRYQVQAVEIVE